MVAVSSSLSLSMPMVFSASASGKRAYDPICFYVFVVPRQRMEICNGALGSVTKAEVSGNDVRFYF